MVGLVLGSGLGSLLERAERLEEVSFARAGLPESTVPGHVGRLLKVRFAGRKLWLMQGRVHLYEGYAATQVTAGVGWLAAQGVTELILTNAAGALHPEFEVGNWMLISDQMNLTGDSPLRGPQFVDLSTIYDEGWRAAFFKAAARLGITLHQGVYAGLRGPQYETPAEIRMLRTLGADAVGMSTVLEAIAARALGLRVVGFSCLTNWAAGLQAKLNHHEVLVTGRDSAGAMLALLEHVLCEGAI